MGLEGDWLGKFVLMQYTVKGLGLSGINWIFRVGLGLFELVWDCKESFGIVRDGLGLLELVWDCQELFEIVRNGLGLS